MERYTIRCLETEKKCCCPVCGQAHQGRNGLGLFADDQEAVDEMLKYAMESRERYYATPRHD